MFCFIYTTAFLVDTLNTYGVLSINNNIIKDSLRKKAIMDVVDFDTDTYKISSKQVDIDKKDGLVCNINFEVGYDSVYYIFNTYNKNIIINYDCNFITFDEENNVFIVDNTIEIPVDEDSRFICDIILENDIFYISTKEQRKPLENNINFIIEDNKISINNSFLVDKSTINDKYFTTNLPDTLLHYDGLNHMYIQNIGNDFLKNFLIGTNSILFFCLVFMYILALVYWGKHNIELSYFVSKPVVISNVVGLIALGLGILISIILFI